MATNKTTTLAQLNIGEKGVIVGFTEEETSLKLLEMGCLPGCEIFLDSKAPLGDPICISGRKSLFSPPDQLPGGLKSDFLSDIMVYGLLQERLVAALD